jgi:hypothetical protein
MALDGERERFVDRFRDDGFKIYQISLRGLETTVATNEEFRLKWLATRMIHFAFTAESPQVTQADIDEFSALAFEHARQNYSGLPRGFQKGFVVYPTLISYSIDPAAKRWVESELRTHFAAFEMPVLVDRQNGTLHYHKKTPLWGRMYYKTFRQFVERYYRT